MRSVTRSWIWGKTAHDPLFQVAIGDQEGASEGSPPTPFLRFEGNSMQNNGLLSPKNDDRQSPRWARPTTIERDTSPFSRSRHGLEARATHRLEADATLGRSSAAGLPCELVVHKSDGRDRAPHVTLLAQQARTGSPCYPSAGSRCYARTDRGERAGSETATPTLESAQP